jgi:hypothetical protein
MVTIIRRVDPVGVPFVVQARLGIFDRTGRPRTHAGARGIVLGSFILSIFAGVLSLAGQLLHEDVEVIHALPEWSIKRRHVPGHRFSQSAVFRRLTSTWAVLVKREGLGLHGDGHLCMDRRWDKRDRRDEYERGNSRT